MQMGFFVSRNPNDELIKLCFIARICDDGLKVKILDKLHFHSAMDISQIFYFCQMNAKIYKTTQMHSGFIAFT